MFFLAHPGWLEVCVCLAPSGLLVSDVMVIVVEGELRGRRRYLFCVCVGVESSCALLIALAIFVDLFYLLLRAHDGCPVSVGTSSETRQSTSQLQSLSGLIFPSCVLSYTGFTLLNNTCQTFTSTSFWSDDGFQERSDVAPFRSQRRTPSHFGVYRHGQTHHEDLLRPGHLHFVKRLRLPKPITSISCFCGLLMLSILVDMNLLHLLQLELGFTGG